MTAQERSPHHKVGGSIKQIWHAKSENYCKLAEVFAALVEREGGV
ncbi:hypothetical protein [Shewanella algae]